MAEANRSPRKKGAPSSVWSEDETRELIRLCWEFRDDRFINKCLEPHFPSKTNRQIRDKRKLLQDQGLLLEEQPPQQEQVGEAIAGPSQAVDEAANIIEEAVPQEEEVIDLDKTPEFVDASDVGDIPGSPATEQEQESMYEKALKETILAASNLSDRLKVINERIKEASVLRSITSENIEQLYSLIVDEIACVKEADGAAGDSNRTSKERRKKTHKRTTRGGRRGGRPMNRTERKRYAYARCQELFDNEPTKLADIVASNDFSLVEKHKPPLKESVETLYKSLWDVKGPEKVSLPGGVTSHKKVEDILTPVTAAEVAAKVRSIDNSSAAGLDKVVKGDLKKKGVYQVLANFYNLLFLAKGYPSEWRKNRTTLIPKVGKDTCDAKNWRPITISSMLSRIYSAMIERRLRRALKQNERQKGFTEANGCYENIRIFSEAIKMAKKKGGTFSVKDVAKAFDTVPHAAIAPSLERKGIPKEVASYITSMYEDCKTVIKADGGEVNITLQRGVKQGDPLSPLIFNLCIEPLLERLQEETEGLEVNGSNLAAMAFADDLVVIGKDAETVATQTRMTMEYLKNLGMTLSIGKCACFEMVSKGKTWYAKDPGIEVEGEKIPYSSVEEVIKYLGVKITPWRWLVPEYEIDGLKEVFMRTKKLPLKPMQKIELLTTYLLPKFTYGLIANPPSAATLKKIDGIIRTECKTILHISDKTSTAFIYAPKRKGGLGLLNMEQMVYLASLRNAIKAMRSKDPIIIGAMATRGTIQRLSQYADAVGLQWPTTIEDIDKKKTELKDNYVKEWAKQKVQGQGVHDFSESISNEWLRQTTLLKHSRIADAIKLRTNTYPTKMCLKRCIYKENPQYNTDCRKCGKKHETLGHILGECMYTKGRRIRRHDEIKMLIAEKLAVKNKVLVEQSFGTVGDLLKPDLVALSNEGEALVLDVTVRFEKDQYLAKGAKEKVSKYKKI